MGWSISDADHTNGFGPPDGGHLNADQFVAELDRARSLGVLSDRAQVFATHLAHRSNPPHEELARLTAPAGYIPAYDGLRIEILPGQRSIS